MKNLIHLPLEPYVERYTEFLADWEKEAFKKHFNYSFPKASSKAVLSIQEGQVLDTLSRPRWCLHQIDHLIRNISDSGILYFSDFYTSGIDALAYAKDPRKKAAFLWAQTFDQYDFTAKEHMNWMRPYEIMAFEIYDVVFVAQDLLKDLIVTAVPAINYKIEVVGLPFNSKDVYSRAKIEDIPEEGYDVVYSSRWDAEKSPDVFLDLIEAMPDLTYVVCSGSSELRGDLAAISRLYRMRDSTKYNITIRTGLTKSQYYGILRKSTIQFNCALQDWVSFTLLEALTFGCRPVYPMHRGFPEALLWRPEALYAPFSPKSAANAVAGVLSSLGTNLTWQPDWGKDIIEYHDGTLERISQTLGAL